MLPAIQLQEGITIPERSQTLAINAGARLAYFLDCADQLHEPAFYNITGENKYHLRIDKDYEKPEEAWQAFQNLAIHPNCTFLLLRAMYILPEGLGEIWVNLECIDN